MQTQQQQIQSQHQYLEDTIDSIIDEYRDLSAVEYNEDRRYIPASVSRFSGYFNSLIFPYWIEILNCFSLDSNVNEVSVMKGVQVAYTTHLESLILYLAGYIKTLPGLFYTADLGLSEDRMENNIIPMFRDSGMMDIFESSDTTNKQKKGKTKKQLQWQGGGYLLPKGAQTAKKMRQASAPWILLDEISGWPWSVDSDGNPVLLCKDRASAFWDVRKIFMGSTPLIKGKDHIENEFKKGDQRYYFVRCLKCGEAQVLRWSGQNKDTKKSYGMAWDYKDNGSLDESSVRYHCKFCHGAHEEHDKVKLFRLDNAEWRPTATPVSDRIRSYHLSAMYSPAGVQPWHKCVQSYLDGWDDKKNIVKDISSYQRFYNNILGQTFELKGSKITPEIASSHRRYFYSFGQIPNEKIIECSESEVLFIICTVDVQDHDLAVAVWGVTSSFNFWLIDYDRLVDDSETGTRSKDSITWRGLQEIIEEKVYTSDNKKRYRIAMTLIDAGHHNEVVNGFCDQYESGVYPILGRTLVTAAKIKEFGEFKTKTGGLGFLLNVDYYKDRMSAALRRMWNEDEGEQKQYHFNAPTNVTNEQLKELTKEFRIKKELKNGKIVHEWKRPQGSKNELWDLFGYANAAVEILANLTCKNNLELPDTDWAEFWNYASEGNFLAE